MAPFAWLIGIPWSDAPLAGQLMGTKIVLNELVAFHESELGRKYARAQLELPAHLQKEAERYDE